MKVRILMEVSDHNRRYVPPEVCEMADDQAASWLKRGFAEAVADEPEAATPEPEENAAMPRARKRG
jgi:hypothetical protein